MTDVQQPKVTDARKTLVCPVSRAPLAVMVNGMAAWSGACRTWTDRIRAAGAAREPAGAPAWRRLASRIWP